MVERDLAKVEVAGSSPVFRSEMQADSFCYLLFFSNTTSFFEAVSVTRVVELVDTQDLKSCSL